MMGFDEAASSQLFLSLLAFAVVLVLYAVTKWRGGSVGEDFDDAPAQAGGTRVLVLANETVGASELLDELRAIDNEGKARVLRLCAGEPGGHRAGRTQRRGVGVGGDDQGRPGPARLHAGDPAG